MAVGKMKWDQDTERLYEGGVDMCALFPIGSTGYEAGVPWNGLTKIEEKPTGAEIKKKYANKAQMAARKGQRAYVSGQGTVGNQNVKKMQPKEMSKTRN